MAYKQLKLWFDGDLADLLSAKICAAHPSFPSGKFKKYVTSRIPNLELKDRVEVIADALDTHISKDYPGQLSVLLQILGPKNEKETGMFTEYYWLMPVAKFVEKYGLSHFDLSMNAIREITQRNTGEYTIRPYLEQMQEKTLGVMLEWSHHENRHVRRLASEGVRPRLPWAKKLDIFVQNPVPILPILENLKDDTSKYVQKSVANCLNDILKDNPATGKKLIDSWVSGTTPERKWIIRHALRNLKKQEDEWALEIIAGLS